MKYSKARVNHIMDLFDNRVEGEIIAPLMEEQKKYDRQYKEAAEKAKERLKKIGPTKEEKKKMGPLELVIQVFIHDERHFTPGKVLPDSPKAKKLLAKARKERYALEERLVLGEEDLDLDAVFKRIMK